MMTTENDAALNAGGPAPGRLPFAAAAKKLRRLVESADGLPDGSVPPIDYTLLRDYVAGQLSRDECVELETLIMGNDAWLAALGEVERQAAAFPKPS
jgi:hypothetical protein